LFPTGAHRTVSFPESARMGGGEARPVNPRYWAGECACEAERFEKVWLEDSRLGMCASQVMGSFASDLACKPAGICNGHRRRFFARRTICAECFFRVFLQVFLQAVDLADQFKQPDGECDDGAHGFGDRRRMIPSPCYWVRRPPDFIPESFSFFCAKACIYKGLRCPLQRTLRARTLWKHTWGPIARRPCFLES